MDKVNSPVGWWLRAISWVGSRMMEPLSSPARTLSNQRISASVTACRYSVYNGRRQRRNARLRVQWPGDHVHANLIDQAEREGLPHDGRAMQADDLLACCILGLLDRAGNTVGDERVHSGVRRSGFV